MESERLKKYDCYVEKNTEIGKWQTKYQLSNGLVKVEKTYWGKQLRAQREFEYDEFGNQTREIETYNINDGKVNKVSVNQLTYKDSNLIRRETDDGLVETYSDFNQFGKPKVIDRSGEFGFWPFKEILEYDKNGNIIKSVECSYNLDDKSKIEKAITHYKYNSKGNIVQIHREFRPKKEFPIRMAGGPHEYEYEYYRYVYNKDGLWTKKFKMVNGKEYLVAKRKYR